MKTVDAPFCQHSFSLPTEAFSVPRVRAEAAKIFAGWGLTREDPAVDVALLALSELMTNCVQHASADSPFADLTLTEEAGDLVIAVHDRHPRMPRVLAQPHADHIGGRGLLLVQRLAAEEGGATVMTPDLDGEGKTVTVRLPLRPRDEYATSKEITVTVAQPSVVATDTIVIRPSGPLTGTVHVDGSKNAALPLLAAAAAVRHPVHLSNVPTSSDVQAMLTLLQQCGYHIARPVTDPSTTVILPTDQLSAPPNLPDAGRIRASYYLVPALLAACGRARLPWPGGCSIGERFLSVPHGRGRNGSASRLHCSVAGAAPNHAWVRPRTTSREMGQLPVSRLCRTSRGGKPRTTRGSRRRPPRVTPNSTAGR
jgi:anti-sigma regulatory factor (Ser/Thr protein kinase)